MPQHAAKKKKKSHRCLHLGEKKPKKQLLTSQTLCQELCIHGRRPHCNYLGVKENIASWLPLPDSDFTGLGYSLGTGILKRDLSLQ